MRIRVLGIVLAGGKGTRLYPLTKERAKPAVPFGGKYRIIDFVLSNFINSGIYSIYVLTQFRSQSLLQHLSEGWQFGGLLKSQFIIPVPAQMRSPGETWYQGTADAIYQNINLVEQSDPDVVAIFGGDHIYRMNITNMIEYHVQKGAEVTVAAIPVDKRACRRIRRDRGRRGRPHPGVPRKESRRAHHARRPRPRVRLHGQLHLLHAHPAALLHDDAAEETAATISAATSCPSWPATAKIYAYDFQTNRIPGEPADAAALLARRGHHRRLLRSQHGPALGEPRAESVQPGVAAAQRQLPGPAGQVHFRRGQPARAGHRQHRFRRLHSVRRDGAQFGAGARRARAYRARWWRSA